MPKSRISKQQIKRNVRRNRNRNSKRKSVRSGSNQSVQVHRRLVMYPNTTPSSWLSSLAWFSSVALKLFNMVTGIGDDFITASSILGSGIAVFLGAGDFASHSPFAVPVVSAKKDAEVKALRTFPFERSSFKTIQVKIVPSADMGVRGGMYAASLIKLDTIDAQTILALKGNGKAKGLVNKFSASYDDIIKHPKAVLAPVNKSISLFMKVDSSPHNIRAVWSDDLGFTNAYPCCVLSVAFSDLASAQSNIDDNYSPAKSLFEVHMKGSIQFLEPGELDVNHQENLESQSNYTAKLLTTNSKDTNLKFFNYEYEAADGKLDIRTIDVDRATEMLRYYNKEYLIPKLLEYHRTKDEDSQMVSSFEAVEVS